VARKNKKDTLGNYVKKVGYIDVYQKFTFNRQGKAEGSSYRLVHAKNVLRDNLNSIFIAEQSASTLVKDNIKYDKYGKS
jgi:hypothetical protein